MRRVFTVFVLLLNVSSAFHLRVPQHRRHSLYATVPDLALLTVAELKIELKARGLTVTGLKKDLVERLSAASNVGDDQNEQTEAVDDDSVLALMVDDDDMMPISQTSSSSSSQRQRRTDPNAPAADVDAIQKLCSQRNELRYQRDFDGADAVRAQLEAEHGVIIYDYKNQWVAQDGSSGPLTNHQRQVNSMFNGALELPSVPAADVPTTLTVEQIMALCRARTAARRNRDWQEADTIRDELAQHGVELYDNANAWRTHDGQMRGEQSDDFNSYQVEKDRGVQNRREKVWKRGEAIVDDARRRNSSGRSRNST